MPTDLGLIVANLTSFYDFRHKIVVHVGEPRITQQALQETVSVATGDFCDLDLGSPCSD